MYKHAAAANPSTFIDGENLACKYCMIVWVTHYSLYSEQWKSVSKYQIRKEVTNHYIIHQQFGLLKPPN